MEGQRRRTRVEPRTQPANVSVAVPITTGGLPSTSPTGLDLTAGVTWALKVVPSPEYIPRLGGAIRSPLPSSSTSRGLTRVRRRRPYISPLLIHPLNSHPTPHELVLQEETHLSHFYHHRPHYPPS